MEKRSLCKTPDTEMVRYLVVVLSDLLFLYTSVSASALGFCGKEKLKGFIGGFIEGEFANLYCFKV